MPSPPRHLRTRTRVATWVAAVALALTLAPGAPTAAQTDPRDRLAETERRIDATLAELDALEGRMGASEEAVAAAEAKVAELEEALNAALAALEEQRVRVRLAAEEVERAEAETIRIEANLNRRARTMFKGDVPAVIRLVSSTSDLEDTLDGVAMLSRLAARDGADLESLDAARTAAAAAGEYLRAEQAELEVVHAERERLLQSAEEALAEHEQTLATLASQEERLLARQEALQEESKDIERIIAAEEAARQRAAAPSRSSGSSGSSTTTAPAPPPPSGSCYAWPARGRVTSEYGPRWGRMHAGIDIDGNTGDPIYAAQDGVVISAGWQGGYGQLTLIRHGDGVVTAYAHQSSIGVSKGQTVARGQFIGRIGTTGNVTGSHLHFETRVNGSAVNPRRYLC